MNAAVPYNQKLLFDKRVIAKGLYVEDPERIKDLVGLKIKLHLLDLLWTCCGFVVLLVV
jgi:hypothetical protein